MVLRRISVNHGHAPVIRGPYYEEPPRRSNAISSFMMTIRRKLRAKRAWFLIVAIILGYIFFYGYNHPAVLPPAARPYIPSSRTTASDSFEPPGRSGFTPVPLQDVLPSDGDDTHPMLKLITKANSDFDKVQKRQSQTIQEAVTEYKRRHGLPPPPNFDKWYEFAKSRNVPLIDEYDSILESLTPFWGMKPATIRARARETQGYDNVMISMLIRHGNVTKIDGGRDWMLNAMLGMVKHFTEFLPDMDLCINAHDEPRVILPHQDLARLVAKAKNINMARAANETNPVNKFSVKPPDMTDGTVIFQVLRSRFNAMQKQETWTHSRISCPQESPARSLDEDVADNMTSYATGQLGFIHNTTAFSDICSSPSFADSFGFFSGANVFNVVHDLFPIFSQSKPSSYQDILFPSPWYWDNKVPYEADKDLDWRKKEDKLWWRGSTTGGYSRGGSWRHQHRQHVVQTMTASDQANILAYKNTNSGPAAAWKVSSVFRPDYSSIVDMAFTEIGQCDPGDCKAQKDFFHVVKKTKPEEAWRYKFLLDMDGNAFSGRFYAFLKSKSLVFKMAIFREWHSEVLKPWVHYIPLSLRGTEWLESVRWLLGEQEGKLAGEKMARASSEWARKVLRNEDMEVWLFRLLLEYGRVIDDNREYIGYDFPHM